ncbi:MAG: hypothetical protein HY820_29365, partial [Acidobacteria bacterium]|nr:hypothetical protein [Acidobacteriota bacterium]
MRTSTSSARQVSVEISTPGPDVQGESHTRGNPAESTNATSNGAFPMAGQVVQSPFNPLGLPVSATLAPTAAQVAANPQLYAGTSFDPVRQNQNPTGPSGAPAASVAGTSTPAPLANSVATVPSVANPAFPMAGQVVQSPFNPLGLPVSATLAPTAAQVAANPQLYAGT